MGHRELDAECGSTRARTATDPAQHCGVSVSEGPSTDVGVWDKDYLVGRMYCCEGARKVHGDALSGVLRTACAPSIECVAWPT